MSNANIISEAQNAVSENDIANAKHAASLYLADYYLGINDGTISKTTTAEDYVKSELTSSGIDASIISITEEGKIVVNYQLPDGVSIADEVNYTAPASQSYTGKWRVLGMDENGNIQLVSDFIDTVDYNESGSTEYGADAYEAYNNIIDAINEKANAYADGTYATSGRSIKLADINKITGYNPRKVGGTSGQVFDEGAAREYGNSVTYKLTNSGLSLTGTNGVSNTVASVTQFIPLGSTDSLAVGETYTAKSTYYSYYPTTLTATRDDTASVGVAMNSKEWNMLFDIPTTIPTGERVYWIADKYVETGANSVNWGIMWFDGAPVNGSGSTNTKQYRITGTTLWTSNGGKLDNYAQTPGIKVVLTLNSNCKLVASSTDGVWDLEMK